MQCNAFVMRVVEMYFLFVISLCVFAVIITMVVLHLYLRADDRPVAPMPAWVNRHCICSASIIICSSSLFAHKTPLNLKHAR